MAGRIRAQLIVAAFCFGFLFPGAQGNNAVGILAQYSFDDENIETGPDTFAVYKASKGTVELSSNYRYSGFQSVAIQDIADDQDFPELQGFFPLRTSGMLYAHFALLITNPDEPLNIALAGPKWFSRQKDGIAFWLSTDSGILHHYSDSIPKKLFRPTPFTWYLVDIEYNITRGTYELIIHEEGSSTPVINLSGQPNGTSQPGSAVDKFSFIGDTGKDTSGTLYYIDDVIIGIDEQVNLKPFIAPGRRRLFLDMWMQFQKKAKGYPACLPAMSLAEHGISTNDYARFAEGTTQVALSKALSDNPMIYNSQQISDAVALQIINAIGYWNRGCFHLGNHQPAKALKFFTRSRELVPQSDLYTLSYALAAGAAGNKAEAEGLVASLYGKWSYDPRMAVALSMIALANNEAHKSEYELHQLITSPEFSQSTSLALNRGPVPADYTAEIGSGFPLQWRQAMHSLVVEEQYFLVLLWQGKHKQALDFAFGRATSARKGSWLQPLWYERAGDAAYLSGEPIIAINLYETSLDLDKSRSVVLGKLSDLYYQIGDLTKERALREKIYGTLRPTPVATGVIDR